MGWLGPAVALGMAMVLLFLSGVASEEQRDHAFEAGLHYDSARFYTSQRMYQEAADETEEAIPHAAAAVAAKERANTFLWLGVAALLGAGILWVPGALARSVAAQRADSDPSRGPAPVAQAQSEDDRVLRERLGEEGLSPP